jgi:pimeloyl-ACP methyl ester carboxylesterase
MDQPQIRYTKTSDGVNIAHAEAGEGRTLIHFQALGYSHAELSWQYRAALLHPLAEAFHLVYYDGRGSGLSDRIAIEILDGSAAEEPRKRRRAHRV